MTASPEAVANARSLPDEYASLPSASSNRVLELVARRWGDRSEGDRRNLAQILIMVLEPLNEPGARITDDIRTACEQVVTDWVEKTRPTARGPAPAVAVSQPEKSRRVRLVQTAGGPEKNGDWMARVVLQVGARQHAGIERGAADQLSQLTTAAKATIQALRQAVPAAAHIEFRKLETFEAFESIGVIVALRMTDGDQQSTLVGVCPNAREDIVRGAAIAVLNATNRRLGTG